MSDNATWALLCTVNVALFFHHLRNDLTALAAFNLLVATGCFVGMVIW